MNHYMITKRVGQVLQGCANIEAVADVMRSSGHMSKSLKSVMVQDLQEDAMNIKYAIHNLLQDLYDDQGEDVCDDHDVSD